MKTTKILVATALAAVLSACNLDYTPYDSITEETAIQSPADIKRMSTALYAGLRTRSYGQYNIYADLCTEDFVATTSYANSYFGAANWNKRTSSDEYLTDIWREYYFLIVNANLLINSYHRTTYTTKADSLILHEALGTAYTIRAFAYNYLAARFALPYYSDKNGGTSYADSLGVPLELEINLSSRLPRATLREVYQRINTDLDSATVHMTALNTAAVPTESYKGSPARFNLDAVNALRSRVALYQGEWQAALTAAEAVINTGKYPLSNTADALKKLWAEDQGTEIITHLFISDTETPNSHNELYAFNQNYRGYLLYIATFLPTQNALALYSTTDYRLDAYYSQQLLIYEGGIVNGLMPLTKFPRTTEFTPAGNTAHSPIIFRSAEAYLTAAEAAVRLGDDAKAQTYLNTLRASRGLTATTATSATLLSEIQQERRKEFMGEGHNLVDKKRWHQAIDRSVMGGQRTPRYNPIDAISLNLRYEADDPRFVWPIPNQDINNNANLVQNPGY